MICIWHCG
jgi:hypothetical protein